MQNEIQHYRDGKLQDPTEFINQFPSRYNEFHKKTRIIKEKAAFKI